MTNLVRSEYNLMSPPEPSMTTASDTAPLQATFHATPTETESKTPAKVGAQARSETNKQASYLSSDVLIVGAGPAGCAAAITLAQAGVDVLLIDQHDFPRDKVCGDGLIPDAMA
ncbi:MAG TPA: FAD-dependent oxidoreductase, partial [Orrella sp.]